MIPESNRTSDNLKTGFRLGSLEIRPMHGEISDGQQSKRVQPKSMDVLLYLAAHAGEVVSREDVLRNVWGERAQSDEPLTRCIGELRRAFGDARGRPEYIQTIPKRGYQLLKVPELFSSAAGTQTLQPEPAGSAPAVRPRMQWRLQTKIVAGITAAIMVAIIAYAVVRMMAVQPESQPTQALVSPAVESRSIAVLPFADLSAKQDHEYLADGVAEELLNMLARISELRVISRTSAFSYKGKNFKLTEVASELNVAHVLEGSVRTFGDKLRITAQLIDARTDTHIWSISYDRPIEDMFVIQDEIAAAVVEQLKLSLLPGEMRKREIDTQAYLLYLQAQHFGRNISAESLEHSNELLEKALALDPGFADAWVGLASNYNNQATNAYRPFDEGFRLAQDAANKALEADPNSAGAYAYLGWTAMWNDHDPSASAQYYERALEYDPSNLSIIGNAALLLKSLGRLDEALDLLEFYARRDPLNPTAQFNLGLTYLSAGRWAESIELQQATLQLSPEYWGSHTFIATALLMQGKGSEALEMIEKEPSEAYRLLGRVMVLSDLGQRTESEAALTEMIDRYENEWAYNIAYVLAYRNDVDRAFEWLDKAVEYGDPGLADIVAEVLFSNLHADPRWAVFLERIGKSPEQQAAIEFNVRFPERR